MTTEPPCASANEMAVEKDEISPLTVLFNVRVETYPANPRPSSVDVSCEVDR